MGGTDSKTSHLPEKRVTSITVKGACKKVFCIKIQKRLDIGFFR